MPEPIIYYDMPRKGPEGWSDAEQSWSLNTLKYVSSRCVYARIHRANVFTEHGTLNSLGHTMRSDAH